jgi:UDP-N-acetylglucosamine 3-dehydrogenase
VAERTGRREEPLRVGLIGLGEVGQHHLLGYASTGRARVVAVADLSDDLTTAAAAATGAARYAEYAGVLDDPAVEAVDVSLPHDLLRLPERQDVRE